MPRAPEYRAAAHMLRQRGDAYRDAAWGHRRHHRARFGEGPVADAHDDAIESIASHLDRAGSHLHELATVCDRRAEICADYATELRRWRQLDWADRLATPRPRPVASWVEA